MIVVGTVASSGNFNGFDYDNVKLHCLRTADASKGQEGQLTEVVKIPRSLFDEKNITIGSDIVPLYDRFQRVVDLKVL